MEQAAANMNSQMNNNDILENLFSSDSRFFLWSGLIYSDQKANTIKEILIGKGYNFWAKAANIAYLQGEYHEAHKLIRGFFLYNGSTNNFVSNESLLLAVFIHEKLENYTEAVGLLERVITSYERKTSCFWDSSSTYTNAMIHAKYAELTRKFKPQNSEILKSTVLIEPQNRSLSYFIPEQGELKGKAWTHENINLIGIMRVKNEGHCIGEAIKCLYKHVDEIVVYDDKSNDDTVEVINRLSANGIKISVETANTWIFNESLIHQKLFDVCRKKQATHILQLDADEILSGNFLTESGSLIREIASRMNKGDCLALPWTNITSQDADIAEYIDSMDFFHRSPSRRVQSMKDIMYCDDGKTNFSELHSIHVNTVPEGYKQRFIVLDKDLSLFHLEQLNMTNFLMKKDWYKCLHFNKTKVITTDPYSDVSLDLFTFKNSKFKQCRTGFSKYENFKIAAFDKCVSWRKDYICGTLAHAGSQIPELTEALALEYNYKGARKAEQLESPTTPCSKKNGTFKKNYCFRESI